jgi:hypothetical protein
MPVALGVLRIERRFVLPHRHGAVLLDASCGGASELLGADAGDIDGYLFLDTETSGLAGGTGTWVFVCGLARFDGPALVVRQYLLTRLDAEPDYLALLQRELDDADVLVTYNGKVFDVPLLATRFRLGGLRGTLETKTHLDLLFEIRRAFGRVWPDCRLSTAEVRLLHFNRVQDLPGSEAPRAWLSWLRRGTIDPLARVLVHNLWDLLSLPALVRAMVMVHRTPAAAGADVRALAGHYRRRGDQLRALKLLEANRDELPSQGLLELASLCRQRGDRGQALEIWNALAARGVTQAIDALAKHLEHREGSYRAALAMAQRLPPGPERDRRCARLNGRLGKRTGTS